MVRAHLCLCLGCALICAGVQGDEVLDSQPAARRCYWCGPLAEQVHRSERTEPCGPDPRQGPCDSPDQVCATIASAPPYAESRLCVNKFREACFPLFCNTSNVWKAVCTCRGDLCNGPVTQQAALVFNVLAAVNYTHTKSLVRREVASLHDPSHDHDTDVVNQLATFSSQLAMSTDKPTDTTAGDIIVNNVDNAALQVSKYPDIAKEGDLGSDKDLRSGMNQQSDEPRHEHADNMSVKEAKTTAAAKRAAVDPDQQHNDHEHGVMATHSPQLDKPDNLTELTNQTVQGLDTPKNDAQKWSHSLAFDALIIISIKFSLLGTVQ